MQGLHRCSRVFIVYHSTNSICQSQVKSNASHQIMVDRLARAIPHLGDRIRTWPSDIHLGDMFSGAGTFFKVSHAAFNALTGKFPKEMSSVKVLGVKDLYFVFCIFIFILLIINIVYF